ncbi:MAG: helix-turn-helix domain-containing protein, partial [Poseidonibacter sp.]|uniref:helix-turn-helix domain-containing protein n=1 Tax=Poseidonibacter sp. TaxID=2321188 RepID=UPI00359D8FB4
PHAFLVNKRIEKARNKMLNNKEISLAQLSSEVGFYDQSHFSKVFKRVFAISPNKYRLD